MKALILAAGYATRLRPLTDSIPKMLLPLAERPMLDYLLDRIREVGEIDEIHLVTNAQFATAFRDWAPDDVTVHDDGTTSNEDRLGAIGDIAFAIGRGGLAGADLFVVAGDNLIGYSLAGLRRFLARERQQRARPPRGLRSRAAEELRRRRARRGRSGRRLPGEAGRASQQPGGDSRVPLPRRARGAACALSRGREPAGRAGQLRRLALQRAAVHGYRVSGEWHDIGDLSQLLEADNLLRKRAGLPTRSEYSLT